MPWNLDADSPLLSYVDGAASRARFSFRPPPVEELSDISSLFAGAAQVDITPPPGMPKAGYSSNANDGTGVRTRLRARVIHLRSGSTSMALVQCDLLGGSAVVQHLVAQAIAAETDVPLHGLFIGATHTHAGPGQFLGTDFYNRFASNRSGFDPAWTQWLAGRIAGAVIEAVKSRRPARLAFGQTDVWGLTRNRSLAPHVRNAEVEDPRTEPQRKYVNVNPQLNLLRVDAADGDSEPLAAMVVFSVHGTGISMKSKEYNADLWAYLVGELRNRIAEATGTAPVVGAVEGTHADVAPAIRPTMAGHVEAQRIGRAIGAKAAALYDRMEADLRADVVLGASLREIDLEQSRTIDRVTLPRRPAVGAALVAGAHENLTPVVHRIPPFRAGTPKPWRTQHAQGQKWVLGSRWFQPLVLQLRAFPRVLPVQVLRVADVALVGLPFEVTVASGRRIQAAVASATVGTGVERAVVSSVANEYSGYVATAEEYELQYYEGGHTLYGPSTQGFLSAHAAKLAGTMGVADVLAERTFDLAVRRFLPTPSSSGPKVERSVVQPAAFCDPTTREDGQWELRWRDVAPGDLHWHEPLVTVDASDGGDSWWHAVLDQGWALEIEHLGHDRQGPGHIYAVRWHDPDLRAGRRHRFVIEANAGRPELISEPFD